jgi:hypothetical protein
MFNKQSRAAALTAALFIAGLGTALAGVQNVPARVRVPGTALTRASAHGMLSSAKRNFVRARKLSARKPGAHGFGAGKGNGKGSLRGWTGC